MEDHRIVRREKPEVVFQHAQPVARDLGIRRIGIDDIRLSARDCLIRKPVIEAADVGEGVTVRHAQRRPPVPAIEEFL